VEEDLEAARPPQIDALLTAYQSTGGRIVVVDSRGQSVADSERVGSPSEDFASRPEIMAALRGERSSGSRPSATAGTDLFYVAVPVVSGGVVDGAVRITYPSSTLDARGRSTWLRLGLLSGFVLALVAGVGILLARSVTRPIRRLRDAAARLAGGDRDVRVAIGSGPPEIRELAATFNVTAERLERLLDSQRQFVADASHQLRTPLAALRLRLETLGPSLQPEDRPKLAAADREAERLGLLVQSLLVLARLDAAPPRPAVIDVAAVIDERIDTWAGIAAEQGVELAADHPPSAPVLALPGALDQILDNLIANAIEASPAGTTIRLVATGERDGVPACVRVIDEGPGMTEEQRAAAFTRFLSTPGTGRASRSGFGLGLAIARRLARKDGGDLELRDATGGGLAAVVHLPRRD
jgi:signal transduction histidine kinase